MKKRIAIFATGWSEQMLSEYANGVRGELSDFNADIYFFICFPSLSDSEDYSNGELNIFKLPNLNDFDGAIVLGNTIDYPYVFKDIDDRCRDAEIPVVYIGHRIDGRYFLGTDNYIGACELCEHLYNEHNVRDYYYVAGSRDNMDSNARLKALSDVLGKNGLAFPDSNIFYTDWSPKNTILFIRGWMERGDKLPGAFVCANDELAIIICEELRSYGIRVPDDVIVTGFDNMSYAKVYDPSISSVSQKFDEIGGKSISMLLNLIDGKECEIEQYVTCEFMPGESCGCSQCSGADEIRRFEGRNKLMGNIHSSAFYRKLSIVDRLFSKSSSYDDIKKYYKQSNDEFNNYERDSYHIVLDPVYKEKIYNQALEYRTEGYPDRMDILFSMDEGNYLASEEFDVRKIVPQICDKKKNHLFICLPLQDAGNCLGYIVFADDYAKFEKSEFMGKYSERISASLLKFQQAANAKILNDKLMELYQTDALTSVKNRTAYNSREEKINASIERGECGEFAVLLGDVNRLKTMNDAWGHERGDIYIKNCCKLICNIFKKSAVYRIGGDEFAVILEDDDYNNIDKLVNTVNGEIEKLSMQDIPEWEKTSIAIGIAHFDKYKDMCVADVLKRADRAMYDRKKTMKSDR